MKYPSALIVKKAREHAHLTQKELAERIHVGTNTLSCWEQGVHRPDLDQLAAVARECEIAIVYLPPESGMGQWEVHPLEDLTSVWQEAGATATGGGQ